MPGGSSPGVSAVARARINGDAAIAPRRCGRVLPDGSSEGTTPSRSLAVHRVLRGCGLSLFGQLSAGRRRSAFKKRAGGWMGPYSIVTSGMCVPLCDDPPEEVIVAVTISRMISSIYMPTPRQMPPKRISGCSRRAARCVS
jgi:hypothetical protein